MGRNIAESLRLLWSTEKHYLKLSEQEKRSQQISSYPPCRLHGTLVSRGQTTRVLLHPSVRIVNIHTVFELDTSTSKRHTEFQHCICAAIQLSSHSLGWCTQAHIPLLLRKTRMRETACVCCGETVSPEWVGTAIKVFQSQWKRRAGRVGHYSV